MSIKHAIKWSFFAELASKVVTPLVFVILARLLTPEDYGVVAAATMVISFSQIFWEAGMSKAYIQYQGDRDAGANAAFWLNNTLGAVVALVLILIAPLLAEKIFHDPRVSLVLRVMALQVFLSALGSIHTAYLQKDMQFRRLFWVRLATVTFPGLISIPLAVTGLGYWALVVGTLAGQAVQLAMLWRMSEWKPSLSFDEQVARRLARFGVWVATSGLLAWFYVWADSLIVGMYLGARELGLYRTGNAFASMIYSLLFGPVLPVLYSHFSSIQEDRERIRQVLFTVVRVITFIAVPTGFVLFAMSEPIGEIVFGSRWSGIGIVIAVMGLMHGFAWVVGANGEAYRAIGHPSYETKIMASTLVFYLGAYIWSIQYGFAVFLWTRLTMALAAMGVHFWVAHIALQFPVSRALIYVGKIALVGLPLLWIGSHIDYFGEDAFHRAMTAAIVVVTWTLGYLWLLERKSLIPETLQMILRRRRERTATP